MKPNSDYHFNEMPDNEPFRKGLGYMVSVPAEQYQALVDALRGLAVAIIAPPTSEDAKAEVLVEARAALKLTGEQQ